MHFLGGEDQSSEQIFQRICDIPLKKNHSLFPMDEFQEVLSTFWICIKILHIKYTWDKAS